MMTESHDNRKRSESFELTSSGLSIYGQRGFEVNRHDGIVKNNNKYISSFNLVN